MYQETERGPIQDDWLLDHSELLENGMTRVIFYHPKDDLWCYDLMLCLEGMTVEEIARRLGKASEVSSWTCKCVESLSELSREGKLCDLFNAYNL